jgi:predicted DNA-binding transcriptional regulator AlpA
MDNFANSNHESLIDERAAAARLGVTAAAMRKWRGERRGPPHVKLGAAVRYSPHALKAWVEARTVAPADAGRVA